MQIFDVSDLNHPVEVPNTITSTDNFSQPSQQELLQEQYLGLGMSPTEANVRSIADLNGISIGSGLTALNGVNSASISQQMASLTASSFSNGTTGIQDLSIKPTDGMIVTLKSKVNASNIVTFKVMPVISESRDASYDSLQMVHFPGAIPIYKYSGPRAFSITAKFASRTIQEATETLTMVNIIRSWVMPYFGRGTAKTDKSKIGAPPDVLVLNAYGKKHLQNIPVVLTNYSFSYNDDVDYIQTMTGEPVPMVWGVSLNVVEAWSPDQISAFDLSAYKNGDLTGAYNPSSNPVVAPAGTVQQTTTPEYPQASYSNEGHNRSVVKLPTPTQPLISNDAFMSGILP